MSPTHFRSLWIVLFVQIAFSFSAALAKDSDITVFDQTGKSQLFFRDIIAERKAIVAFSYANCSRICPMVVQKIQGLQKALGERQGRDVVLVTLTIDPEHDDVSVLKKWADESKAKEGWLFVGADRDSLDAISERIYGGKLISKDMHSPFLLVKGADGNWSRHYGLSPNQEILEKLFPPFALKFYWPLTDKLL